MSTKPGQLPVGTLRVVALGFTLLCHACLEVESQPEYQVSYEDFRETCPIDNFASEGLVTSECMLLLGKAFGVGWASFDDQPHDFNGPTNTVEIVIAGLVLLFGTQQGDVDALLSTNVPFVLNSETDRLFELKELELTTAAEEFWFAYATEWIDTIEMVAELPARMKYTRNTKNVQVTNLTDSNEDLQEDVTAFEAAGYLVHEASHGFVDAHIACATGVISCDMDQESAYGIETWWRYRWLLKNAAELDLDACQRAVDVLESNCRSMFDEGDYPPCVATEALCG